MNNPMKHGDRLVDHAKPMADILQELQTNMQELARLKLTMQTSKTMLR